MQFLILGMGVLVAGLLLMELARGKSAGIWKRRVRVAVGTMLLIAGAALMFRGMGGPASVAIALGLWLVSAPGSGFLGLPGGGQKTPGQSSHVRTEFLDVALDHDTGALCGTVIRGAYEGRAIERLDFEELIDLLQMVSHDDPASAQVIEAVLDREFPDWRDGEAAGSSEGSTGGRAGGAGGEAMTRAYAFKVLGLEEGATVAEIRAAHRDLMQKLHPDHGGSTALAAQINEAKQVLLG